MIYPKLRPFLLEVKEKFLKYKLENILPLKSSYVIRLYEILKDWLEMYVRYGNKAEKILKVEELREILEIPKSYPYGGSSGIKQRILEKAKSELEKYTDVIFDYEEIKTGRKVTHLKFIIRPNPKKLQTDNGVQEQYFKSRKNFVALLRKKYSGSKKFFGFKNINRINYWLGLDKNGLAYGTNGEEIKDFNAVESAEIYDLWLKIAQNSDLYRQLIEQGVCLKDLAKNNKELWLELKEEIIRLKEEGII
jgi:plasmid replication initiation protein